VNNSDGFIPADKDPKKAKVVVKYAQYGPGYPDPGTP
jgi:hypothetical protein